MTQVSRHKLVKTVIHVRSELCGCLLVTNNLCVFLNICVFNILSYSLKEKRYMPLSNLLHCICLEIFYPDVWRFWIHGALPWQALVKSLAVHSGKCPMQLKYLEQKHEAIGVVLLLARRWHFGITCCTWLPLLHNNHNNLQVVFSQLFLGVGYCIQKLFIS